MQYTKWLLKVITVSCAHNLSEQKILDFESMVPERKIFFPPMVLFVKGDLMHTTAGIRNGVSLKCQQSREEESGRILPPCETRFKRYQTGKQNIP